MLFAEAWFERMSHNIYVIVLKPRHFYGVYLERTERQSSLGNGMATKAIQFKERHISILECSFWYIVVHGQQLFAWHYKKAG